jgi:hypothetical protein
MDNKTETTERAECLKALHCLYIAVPEDVARDINNKVGNYIFQLEAKLAQAHSEQQAEVNQIKELHEKKLDRKTSEFVDERDDLAQALSQAYYLVTGRSPEWSNFFGNKEALEDIDASLRLLKSTLKTAEEEHQAEVERLKAVCTELLDDKGLLDWLETNKAGVNFTSTFCMGPKKPHCWVHQEMDDDAPFHFYGETYREAIIKAIHGMAKP